MRFLSTKYPFQLLDGNNELNDDDSTQNQSRPKLFNGISIISLCALPAFIVIITITTSTTSTAHNCSQNAASFYFKQILTARKKNLIKIITMIMWMMMMTVVSLNLCRRSSGFQKMLNKATATALETSSWSCLRLEPQI